MKVNAMLLARELPIAEFCEVCPDDDLNKATQRHHPDYDYPLIVVSCCNSCHNYLNRERQSQKHSGETEK